MSESSDGVVGRDRSELERVWQLADATLRSSSGDVADLAWATMEALAWVWGGLLTTPVTGRRVAAPSAADVQAELAAIRERTAAARTRAGFARLQGSAEALAFALGDSGPFWWSPLEPSMSAAALDGVADRCGGATAAR